jgi:hypothetical protein
MNQACQWSLYVFIELILEREIWLEKEKVPTLFGGAGKK